MKLRPRSLSRHRLTSIAGCLTLLGLALPSTGCLEHPVKAVRISSDQVKDEAVDLAINKDVDVLFVIDNSGSMGEEQAALAKNFGSFVEVLEQKGVDANYRLGVTTSDMGHGKCPASGDRGVLQLKSCRNRESDFTDPQGDFSRFNTACKSICKYTDDQLKIVPTKIKGSKSKKARRWIERIDGETNIADKKISAADAFQCFGPQGINGCGYEAQLDSMYYALLRAESGPKLDSGKENVNSGFMRKSAILAVVQVTDEIDCSLNTENSVFKKESGVYYEKVFGKTSNAFWVKDQDKPSSANCFVAGVECSGSDGGNYKECVSVHKDVDGDIISSDSNKTIASKAVLRPVDVYIDKLKAIEAEKKKTNATQEVIVALIGGVTNDEGDVVYRRGYDGTQLEKQNFTQFGIGFGCTNKSNYKEEKNLEPGKSGETVPAGTEEGFAIPPVRLKEFTEALKVDSSQQVLYKICSDDFSGPLRGIAEKIRDQIKPACYAGCVLDTKPESNRLVPSCDVFETDPEGERKKIEECERKGKGEDSYYKYDEKTGEYSIPDKEDVCYVMLTDKNGKSTKDKNDNLDPTCLEKQSNLEFKLQRKRGAAPPAGTKTSAVCELSSNQDLDCPAEE